MELTLGRFADVDIQLHWTLLALIVIAPFVWGLTGLWFIFFLAICVVLHEFGHIYAARKFNNDAHKIILSPIGGMAFLEREAFSPKEEVVVALAGPCVNFALAALVTVIAIVMGVLITIPEWLVQGMVTFLWVNLALGIFNLVPAYPMDGGRVLRGILWKLVGKWKATLWVARVGQVFAGLFVLGGFLGGGMMLVFIGIFIFMTATSEINRLRYSP